MSKYTVIILSCLLSLSGCHWIYQPTIQQGNVVTPQMLQSVKLGMTPEQIRYLLGNPVLIHTFTNNRWDYVYTLQVNGNTPLEKNVTLWFSQGKLVKMTPLSENSF